jgi:hypothetical protein
MRRALSVFFAITVAAALLAFPEYAGAQTKVQSADYPITKSTAPDHLQSGERNCTYFFYTTILGPNQPRISFTYALPDGKTDDEMPRVNDLSVVIDPTHDIPAVRLLGKNAENLEQFQLRMSAATYATEKSCLSGVAERQ